MFKVGHYYRVTHKDGNGKRKCIAKVVKYIGRTNHYEYHEIWAVKVLKSEPSYMGGNGAMIHWYEDYCFNIEELTEAEILACAL